MVLFRLISRVTKGSAAFCSWFRRVGRKESEGERELNNLLYKERERCSQHLFFFKLFHFFSLFFAELCWSCVELWASCLATICYGCRRTVGMDEVHRCCPTPAGAQRQFMVGHICKKKSEWRKGQCKRTTTTNKQLLNLFKWNAMYGGLDVGGGSGGGRVCSPVCLARLLFFSPRSCCMRSGTGKSWKTHAVLAPGANQLTLGG